MQQFLKQIAVFHWFVTIVAVIASVGVWLVFRTSLPPQVPLFYSLPWGEGQLVQPSQLLLLPGIGLSVGIAFGLGAAKIVKETVLVCFMLLTSMIIQIVLLLSLLRILMFIV